MARLLATSGALEGRSFPVEHGLTIGREAHNDISLQGNRHASRDHAKVWKDGARTWAIADLGSTNGTLLNDEPVTRKPLEDGDVIRIGDAIFVFELEEADKPKTAARPVEKAPDLAAVLRGEAPSKRPKAGDGADVGDAIEIQQRVLQYSKKSRGGGLMSYDIGQMAGGLKWALVLLALAGAVGVFLLAKGLAENSRAGDEPPLPIEGGE